MMNGKKIFIVAANLFIILIVLQTHLKPFKDMILSGAEKKEAIQKPSLSDIFKGKFQISVEQWLKQNIGFRGFFVKLDNQINYSMFSEFSRNHPRKIILGKNKYLYEEPYIDSYNRINPIPLKDLENTAASLKMLQDRLLKRNVRVLLMITPSKATIYPEYIPERYILRDNLSRQDNYETLLPILKKNGIHFIDGRQMFLDLKHESVPSLFTSSGSHWSLYGGYLFTARLMERIEQLLGKRLVHIKCRRVIPSREPIELDKDIARLGNILFTRALFTEYIYPETYPDAPAGSYRPNILMVGTSFCWNIIPYLESSRVFSRFDFYYYFNTDYTYPGKIQRHIDRDRVDWEREIFTRDIILIETNEISLSECGFGFIETALQKTTR
jgi:alginate O-acetyltransferase complex protein AlgJ